MSGWAKQPLRIGIAGLGFGVTVHAPVFLALPDVHVVGLAGRSSEKAKAAADKLGIGRGCGSVLELLDLGLDAISIALPPGEVEGAVDAALTRQVPILCEKPLGTDAVTSAGLARRASGVTSAMDFIFAELDAFLYLKQLIDSGEMGAIRHANVLWLTESWAHRNGMWSWKTDAEQHGGVLSLFGAHLFYLAEWLFGSVSTVHAYIAPSTTKAFSPPGAQAAEDLVNCHFQLESGGLLFCSFGNSNPGISIHRWTVVFDNGTVVVENSSIDYAAFKLSVLKPGIPQENLYPQVNSGDGRIQPFSRLARRFVRAVREGKLMQPDLAAGARVQHIDACVRASIASKSEIEINKDDRIFQK